jgi:hypothetical protein
MTMSLDYISIKAVLPVDTPNELGKDESYTHRDYQPLGEKLFPEIAWGSSGSARLSLQGAVAEVEPGAESLTVRMRGLYANPDIISKLAAQCFADSVVVVDAQTSELVTADGAGQSAQQYNACYLSALRGAK